MKKLLFVCAFAAALLCSGAKPELPFTIDPKIPRKISVGKTPVLTLTPGSFDIVECQNTPTVKLAAKEIADALSEVFGTPVKSVAKPSGKAVEIRLGDLELAKKLGVDPAKFDRDGFVIRTAGNKILIIGRDLPRSRPLKDVHHSGLKGEWGTLFGAYDFLERFANVRYYFPGKLGTYTPKTQKLAIPAVDIYDRPDFLQRRFNDYNYDRMPMRRYKEWDGTMNKLRNRVETVIIPNCHGLAGLGYVQRFGKEHPEFFALQKNGIRSNGAVVTAPSSANGYLCWSSGIKEEIVRDAISFLKNEPPSVRGIKDSKGRVRWSYNFPLGTPCFNIMPNDCSCVCRCPECWKHFSKGPQETTDFLWSFFDDICKQVKKSGVPGYLTTMAYGEYRRIPTQKIPDNLLVMLAIRGPWNEFVPASRDSDVELLKAWNRKLGQKTWLWTYPGKYNNNMVGVPHTTPRALSSFIKRVRPYIFGLYIECETDVVMHNYLIYHVFGKLTWNTGTDVEKLLDEHARNLYGPAAKPMKDFFDSIERHWGEIAGNVVETAEGPKTIYPSELILWSKIYSPAEMKRLNGLFDRAEKLAAKDKLVLARIKFVRKEFMEPLTAEAEKFHRANDAVRSWRFAIPEFKGKGKPSGKEWQAAPAFHLAGLDLRKREAKPAEVSTAVRVMYDAENFYFRFECEEKETGKMRVFKRPFDQKEVWQDSEVELFISPDGDRQHYYQVLVNALGSLTDLEVTRGADSLKWNSGAKIATKIFPGKGWQAEITLPRKSMRKAATDGILVDFTRHRVLDGVKVGTSYYCWSPFSRKFGDVSRFGKLLFKPDAAKNLFVNPEFAPERARGLYRSTLDRTFFLTEGASVKMNCGGAIDSGYKEYLKNLKPDTDYEVTFFVRLENVKKLEAKSSGFYLRFDYGNGKCIYYPPYPVQMDGSCPWTGFSFRVHTPKDLNSRKAYIDFNLRKATGTAWLDHLRLIEIPAPAAAR